MKKAILLILGCMSLSACVSNKMMVPDKIAEQKELAGQAEALLSNSPSVVKIKMPSNALHVNEPVIGIPAAVDRDIPHVEFYNSDIQNILFAVANQKPRINFIFEGVETFKSKVNVRARSNYPPTQISNSVEQAESVSRSKLISISYEGKLSGFLSVLQDISGYFFHYDSKSGSIVVKESETFSFVIPNYTNFQKEKQADSKNFLLQEEIQTNLRNLGAHDISYDTFSSSLTFTTDANGFKRVRAYLKGLRDNASLVTMQVMLLEVNLSKNKNAGIDWNNLILGYKSQARNPFGIAASNQASQTSSTDGSGTSVLAPLSAGVGALFTGTGADLFVEAKNFSFGMLFNFLEQYGHYNITQNVRVESMSGTRGKFNVLTETPYVSEVQFTALSQQSTTATAGFKSSTAKSGVEMEIIPYYNKQEGSLSIALSVKVLGVTQMVTLQAGQQFGTINQPETTTKSLENFLRMTPSHIAIIGGLTYEKLNNTSSGIPGESYATKTYQNNVSKNELVMVVKPTVYEFE